MTTPHRPPADIAAELKRLKETDDTDRDHLSLLHEISVYHEELLVQNEALMRAQSVLEETRDRFVELYDFAPNGYVTLDEHGVIRQCNLTAASFLGRPRAAVEGMPFVGFVGVESRQQYFEFLRRCRSGQEGAIELEVTLTGGDRDREVQLLCRPRAGADSTPQLFTSIVDITDRKSLQRERVRTAGERLALATRLLAAIDEERQRIAQNLHDDIGQRLTAIRLTVDRIIGTPEPGDMLSVQHMIEELDQRLHLVATELRPAALALGFVSAARQLVREWGVAHGVTAVFQAAGMTDGDLPADVEAQLYRILQEALNNIAKHAAARHVFVILERRLEEIVLLVEDDGRGFSSVETAAHSASLGLVGMRERAQMIGGRMQVETAPDEGTSLFVYVPIPTNPRAGHDAGLDG